MLEFETEKLSGSLVAYSETKPFKSYWIEEGACAHLSTITGDRAGPNISKPQHYRTTEDAITAANEEDAQ